MNKVPFPEHRTWGFEMDSLQKVYEELVSLRREGDIDEMERLLTAEPPANGNLPSRPDALLILSLAALDEGQFERVLRYSEEMLLAPGADRDIASGLRARALILLGRYAEAEVLLRRCLEFEDERQPADPREFVGMRTMLAEALLARGQIEEAKESLEEDTATHGSPEKPPALALAHRWYVCGKTAAELGSHADAVTCFRHSVRYARVAHQHLFADMAVTAMAASLLARESAT